MSKNLNIKNISRNLNTNISKNLNINPISKNLNINPISKNNIIENKINIIYNELIKSDDRILDFREENLRLPLNFERLKEFRNLKMILSAGDGYNPRNSTRSITDIEYFTKVKNSSTNYKSIDNNQYDILCCLYEYNIDSAIKNIIYLKNHPELNIVLCLFDFNKELELWKLVDLFKNSISVISSDDPQNYLPVGISYRILAENGLCKNVFFISNSSNGYYIEKYFNLVNEKTFKKKGKNLFRGGKKIEL